MPVVAHPNAGEGEVRRLRTLYRLLEALSRSRALEEVYDAALTSLLEATAADRAAILLFDEDGVIRFKASRGLSAEYQAAVTGHTPWPRGTRDAHPLVVSDVLTGESVAAYRETILREGIRALAFVPLALNAGVFGKFMLYYRQPHECSSDELEIARAIGAHVALAAEHKRTELAHLASEQRLQAILDNSTAVIALKDLEGRYVLVNRRFEELFGVSQARMQGRTDFDVFPLRMAEANRANDRAVLDAGKPLAIEEYATHADGTHTYVTLRFPMPGPNGLPAGVCGIATDITETKRLDAASRHLAAIVESSDDAIVSKDLNGIITSWNQGAERIFGYTAEEAIGKPISMLAAPGHLDEIPEILSQIRQGKRVEHFETRRRRKDGQIIDIALTVSPVRDAAGNISRASKIARDITGRKQAEQERAALLMREQDARRTAELLNKVSPRLAAELDPGKLVQEITDLATTLVGAEFGTFLHSVVDEQGESYMLYTLSGVPREALEHFQIPRKSDLFGATFRGEGVVRSDDVTCDPRFGKNADFGHALGHLPVCSFLAAPVVARSGEVLGGLFFGHSAPGKFTEAHQAILVGIAAQAGIAMDNARLFEQTRWAQLELKRSNEELRRTNRDLEVFAYSASHDLQEPLRTIAISAQLLERRWGKSMHANDAVFLGDILTAARRMRVLIEDLLTYTKATRYEEGATPSVDAGQVLEATLESLRIPIDEAGATVTAGALPHVAIHEGRLTQLFQNLISNAIKYCGAEPPRVHVSASERDGWCVFSVADNGIGIDPQYAEQIFGLFKRLHGRDQYPGSGIGLAICQRVVEQYGGRIWLEHSAPGQGATFCFALPTRASDIEIVGRTPWSAADPLVGFSS